MRQRLLTFALVVGCAALFAVSAILTMAEDKKAPVITIEDKDKRNYLQRRRRLCGASGWRHCQR